MGDSQEIYRIFVINPGSTSTKLALAENQTIIEEHNERHPVVQGEDVKPVMEQEEMRSHAVHRFLARLSLGTGELQGVAARGGLLHPLEGGVYRVDEGMLCDLRAEKYGSHASNLGAVLGDEIARTYGCPAFVVDPVVVDELDPVARVTGIPEIERRSIFHALNQKAAARRVASKLARSCESCSFIVAHMGGGISVGAHRKGRIVDVNNALDGEGPLSPERSGGLPAGQLARMCFKGTLSREEILNRIKGSGGLTAYLGTRNLEEVCERVKKGDEKASLIFEAMCYQVSQEICKHGATLRGEVDSIILTGGMAAEPMLVEHITARVGHLAPVEVIPGEMEMQALAESVYAVLTGSRPALTYVPE